jgi:hypothetical protein
MSLARVTDDPVLKEQYEDLAVNFARNAGREQDDLDGKQTSYAEPHKENWLSPRVWGYPTLRFRRKILQFTIFCLTI